MADEFTGEEGNAPVKRILESELELKEMLRIRVFFFECLFGGLMGD